jgi:hypothetical protein
MSNSHLWEREKEINRPKIENLLIKEKKINFNPDPFFDVKEMSKHIGKVNEIPPVYKMNDQTEYKKKPIKNQLYVLPTQPPAILKSKLQYNNKISTTNNPNNFNNFLGSKKF